MARHSKTDAIGFAILAIPDPIRRECDCFGPVAPQGMESNWIPTGEDFFLMFRLYGPDKPLFDKTWTLADVEKIR